MSTATSRARHRDNAAKLGKVQLTMQAGLKAASAWLDTTAGQLSLGAACVVALLAAALIGR